MDASAVLVDVDDGVATITLNRPDVLNVFSGGMGEQLGATFASLDADDDVRAIVLTGAGRAFCAGADMAPSSGSFAASGAAASTFSSSPVTPAPWSVRKPVIAAINGHAIGIGFTIAMACDIRLVAADAKLAIPQVRRGVVPDMQSTWTVRQVAGLAVAADVLLTGRTFLGADAVAMGLASRALPAADVLPESLAVARDIAVNCAPASVALTKALLWGSTSLAETEVAETAHHRLVMGTGDSVEGPAAWMARRAPVWSSTGSMFDPVVQP